MVLQEPSTFCTVEACILFFLKPDTSKGAAYLKDLLQLAFILHDHNVSSAVLGCGEACLCCAGEIDAHRETSVVKVRKHSRVKVLAMTSTLLSVILTEVQRDGNLISLT